MAFTKKQVINILIIVLSVFIILPLILILFNINPYRLNEGMTDYDMTGKNTKMDRVDISGIQDPTAGISGEYGEHIYCYGGDLVCPEGTHDVSFEDVSYGVDGVMFGSTAKYYCVDNTTGESDESTRVDCSSNNIFNTRTIRQFWSHDGEKYQYIRGDSTLTGFTKPYNYKPLKIDGSYVILYDESQAFDFSGSSCFLYEDIGSGCYNAHTNAGSGVTEETNDSETKIPCLADNGSEVGKHHLCCGQEGVLQSTEYNCPTTLPYCKGYKCGSEWGYCQATDT